MRWRTSAGGNGTSIGMANRRKNAWSICVTWLLIHIVGTGLVSSTWFMKPFAGRCAAVDRHSDQAKHLRFRQTSAAQHWAYDSATAGPTKCLKARHTIHGAAICPRKWAPRKVAVLANLLDAASFGNSRAPFARAGRTVKQGMETFAHRRIASSQLPVRAPGGQQHIKLGFHVRKIQRTQCRRRGLAHNMADQIIHIEFRQNTRLAALLNSSISANRGVFRVGLFHQAATRQRLPFILQPAIRHHHLDIQCAGQNCAAGRACRKYPRCANSSKGFEIILKIHRRQVAQQLHVMLRQAQA